MPIKSYLGKTFGGSVRPLVSEGLKNPIFFKMWGGRRES